MRPCITFLVFRRVAPWWQVINDVGRTLLPVMTQAQIVKVFVWQDSLGGAKLATAFVCHACFRRQHIHS